MLEDLHSRLAGVVIECLDWFDVIPRYDSPQTLFYLDPPYFRCEVDYGKDLFGRGDFARMAEVLAGLTGRFVMSINDAPEIRTIFASFALTEVTTTYTIAAGRVSARPELLISNFVLG